MGHGACTGNMSSTYIILVGKPEKKTQLVRRMYKLEDNIKMDLKVVGCDWTALHCTGL
jgi:hypothetical protein